MGKKICSVKITYTYVRTDVRSPLHESRQEIRISSTRAFLVLSNVIVDVTIPRRAFVFGQSRA